MGLDGKTHEFVWLADEDTEIINVLRANETTLSEFIERKEEYIEELQEALHNSLFELEAIEYAAKECLKENKKVYENAPWTLEEMNAPWNSEDEIKATHGSEWLKNTSIKENITWISQDFKNQTNQEQSHSIGNTNRSTKETNISKLN